MKQVKGTASRNDWKALIFIVAVTLGMGALSGFVTSNSQMQYEAMYQPALAPPAWLFPVVWTILYVLMAVAAWLVWKADHPMTAAQQSALEIYALQLLVNITWPVFFFGMEAYWQAFLWLCLLWVLIVIMIIRFARIDRRTVWLLLPYLLWVTFAGYLNLSIALNS